MLGLISLLAFALASEAFASPVKSRTAYTVKETHFVPQKWQQVGKAPGDHVLHLNIGLKQSSFDELERHLYEGLVLPFGCTLSSHASN